MIYIIFLLITLLILIFAFYQWQYYMVFTPKYYRDEKLPDMCEILSIVSDDGTELEGVCYEPKNYHQTLLYFGGRNQDVVGIVEKLCISYPDSRIVSFNYRSYGKSEGVASEKNLKKDALKIAHLVQKHYGDFSILAFSLGTSLASYVASKQTVKHLFLIGAFSSIKDLAKEKYGINFSIFLRYKFDTCSYLKLSNANTYIFASKNDEMVSIDITRKLKNCVKNLKYYVEYENLTHKELVFDEKIVAHINRIL
jgi:hypothetical protein